MYIVAFAVDFDGTLAKDGVVYPDALQVLAQLRSSGRRTILVTGRELPDLLPLLPDPHVFDLIVAENGALLYRPETAEQRLLTDPPPPQLVARLREAGVAPMSIGRGIIATWEPHQTAVFHAIHELGLEHQVIFNKGAVMVLPPGVNKGSGFIAALNELDLSPHNAVAVGDAENDHALLSIAEYGVAVANALPTVKEHADVVTSRDHGDGVAEIGRRILANDLADLPEPPRKPQLLVGHRDDGSPVMLPSRGAQVLIAGPPESGKSSLAFGLLERLIANGYQCCVLDPEGDYDSVPDTVAIGDETQPPTNTAIATFLRRPESSAVVNALKVPFGERPPFFRAFMLEIDELRRSFGRPHWLLVDEAHHTLPSWRLNEPLGVPSEAGGTILVTLDPQFVAPAALDRIEIVIATGNEPATIMRSFAAITGAGPAPAVDRTIQLGEAVVWWVHEQRAEPIRVETSTTPHRRHRRKYAHGHVGPERCFYFRGPHGRCNVQASNLVSFIRLGEEVDEETWRFHLDRGDYARWFRSVIRDDELVSEALGLQADTGSPTAELRHRLRRAIEARYILPE